MKEETMLDDIPKMLLLSSANHPYTVSCPSLLRKIYLGVSLRRKKKKKKLNPKNKKIKGSSR